MIQNHQHHLCTLSWSSRKIVWKCGCPDFSLVFKSARRSTNVQQPIFLLYTYKSGIYSSFSMTAFKMVRSIMIITKSFILVAQEILGENADQRLGRHWGRGTAFRQRERKPGFCNFTMLASFRKIPSQVTYTYMRPCAFSLRLMSDLTWLLLSAGSSAPTWAGRWNKQNSDKLFIAQYDMPSNPYIGWSGYGKICGQNCHLSILLLAK